MNQTLILIIIFFVAFIAIDFSQIHWALTSVIIMIPIFVVFVIINKKHPQIKAILKGLRKFF
jgi:hypothetical protein